jgi:hyperosmotically inducible protein
MAASLKHSLAEVTTMNNFVRGLLVSVLLVLICLIAYTFWQGAWRSAPVQLQSPPVSTSRPASAPAGGPVDVEKARERGAKIGESLAVATNKVAETAEESAITAKVKAKMAFDDQIKARKIEVTTSGTTITLEGTVGSPAEHDRAIALARETSGVTSVADHLVISSGN